MFRNKELQHYFTCIHGLIALRKLQMIIDITTI